MATGSYSAGSFAIPRRCSLPREPMLTGLWGILFWPNTTPMNETAVVYNARADTAAETAYVRLAAIMARRLFLVATGWHQMALFGKRL